MNYLQVCVDTLEHNIDWGVKTKLKWKYFHFLVNSNVDGNLKFAECYSHLKFINSFWYKMFKRNTFLKASNFFFFPSIDRSILTYLFFFLRVVWNSSILIMSFVISSYMWCSCQLLLLCKLLGWYGFYYLLNSMILQNPFPRFSLRCTEFIHWKPFLIFDRRKRFTITDRFDISEKVGRYTQQPYDEISKLISNSYDNFSVL